MTIEREQEILAAYYQTGNVTKAIKIAKCGATTISKIMKKHGFNCGQGKNQTQMKATDAEIIEACKTMTRQEIADAFGMHPDNLTRRFRKLGIHPLYEKDGVSVFNHSGSISNEWHTTENGEKFVRENTNGNFEFVAYKKKTYKIRCCDCGNITTRTANTLKRYKTTCENCAELKKPRNNLINVLRAITESKKDKVCSSCGCVYHSQYATSKYCSIKCKCKCKSKKRGKYKSRARKYGVEYMPGITLKIIYNRDNGICQICGCKTDWNDNSWNGYFGAKYPTIDHVKALANGGGHTWDNVQLACAMCNSEKRDLD